MIWLLILILLFLWLASSGPTSRGGYYRNSNCEPTQPRPTPPPAPPKPLYRVYSCPYN